MEHNKTRTYLLYAVGEIALVVLGILIALQINNWNGERINNSKIDKILEQINKEIEINIESAELMIDFYTTRDSLFERVLTHTTKNNAFNQETDTPQLYLLFNAKRFKAEREGFDLLIQNIDNAKPSIEQVMKELQLIHSTTLESNRASYTRMDNISDTYRTHLVYNTSWFSDFYKKNAVISEEAINHFINDPVYINNLRWYRSAMTSNYAASLREYIHKSRLIHGEINRILDKPNKRGINYILPNEDTKLSTYIGEFISEENENSTLSIFLQDGNLFMRLPHGGNYKLYFIDHNTFLFNNGLKGIVIEKGRLVFKTDLSGFFDLQTFKKAN